MGGVSKDTAIAHSTLRYNLKYKYCPHSIFFYFSLCTIINIYLYLFSINMYLIILKVQFCVWVFNVYNHLYLLQISLFLKKDNIFLKIYPMIITFCVSVQECLHALPRKMWSFSKNVSRYFQRQTVYDTAASTVGAPCSKPGILCHVHLTHSFHLKKSFCSLWFILKYYLFTTKRSFSTEECHIFFYLFLEAYFSASDRYCYSIHKICLLRLGKYFQKFWNLRNSLRYV